MAPLTTTAQPGERYDPVESLTDDTSDVYVRRQEAVLARTRVDLLQHGWRRLLPTLQLTLNARSQNYVFVPLGADGTLVDPALRQWPADTWTLTASWRLNALLDPSPRRRAKAGVRVAEWNLEIARHQRQRAVARGRDRQRQALRERRRQAAALSLRLGHLEARRTLLEAQRELRSDLVRLSEIKYRQGELSYEGLSTQRLALLALEEALLEVEHQRRQAEQRLATLRDGPEDPAPGTLSASNAQQTPDH